MTDKQIITKDVDARGCKFFRNGICASPINPKCKLCVEISEKMCYYKQLKRKENELEELKQYHNKCCEEFKKEKQDLIDKYNQLSRNFYNGDYCNTEHCSLLKSKEQELKNICKAFDIEYAIDEETGNLIGRCNKLYKKEQECEELKEAIDGLLKIQYQLADSCTKYKETLAEIKEIVEQGVKIHDDIIVSKQILQKISEVKDDW